MTKIFHFKEFDLSQEKSAHKLGTDSMLLGAWAYFPEAMNVLDIGTGTGVLALMMAQKHAEAIVDAVEIDPESAREAEANFEGSPWSYRLTVYTQSLQEFTADETLHYDLIVCNPPFFKPINKGKGNNDQHGSEERERARQTGSLSFDDLIIHVNRILVKYGKFYTVLPSQEAIEFREQAAASGLHLIKQLSIRDKTDSPVIRRLMCFSKQPSDLEETELVIYDEKRVWTPEYKSLTADFHLHPDF